MAWEPSARKRLATLTAILMLFDTATVFAKVHVRRPASVHRPSPLQCLGSGIETYGHALVIWPNLGRPVQKDEKRNLSSLAKQDTVELSRIMSLFNDSPKKQVVDIKIDPDSTESGFKSLTNFVRKNKFTSAVNLKAAAVVEPPEKPEKAEGRREPSADRANADKVNTTEKNEKTDKKDQAAEIPVEPGKTDTSKSAVSKSVEKVSEGAKKELAELQKIVESLNDQDLRDLKPHIVSKWKSNEDDNGDETIFFQIESGGRTILAAIAYHDGTQDCLTVDTKAERATVPEGVDPRVIPENYLFNLPVAPPFDVTYFFGPRIFNSMNHSINMERNHPDHPVSVARGLKKPLDYLNKYWQAHSGIDFGVVRGTPVYAPYDGYVFAMGKMGCAGNTLVVAHTISGSDNLIFSVYEHLSAQSFGKVIVSKSGDIVRPFRPGDKLHKGERTRALQIGDPVYQGAVIAKSGASGKKIGFSHGFKEGCVGGAHLHFELRVPKENSSEAAKELAFEHRHKRIFDMGRRFRFVEFDTTPVNPADFIYGVDLACQTRKNLEIQNAIALRKIDKKAIPPITAGLCSAKYEKSLKFVPTIYRLTRQKAEDPGPVSGRNPASRTAFRK